MTDDMRGGSVDGEYDDPKFYAALKANGAAGVLFICRHTRRGLFAQRSEYCEVPHHWGGFGGAIDHGETAEQAVRREITEEAGYYGIYELVPVYRFSSSTFSYQNYLAFVEHEFEPRLQWESSDAQWFTFDALPSPLHPGMVKCLEDPLTKKVLAQHLSETISLPRTPLDSVLREYHAFVYEVEDESDYPIIDDFGNKGIEKAHEVDQLVGERLVVLASKGPFTIRATTSRPANNRAYIFDGETPIGVFDIFTREQDGMKCISTPYSYLRPEYRRKGLGYWFYTHFLDQDIPLASGKTHTSDSKALWQKLADNYRVTVGDEQIVGDIQKYYGTKKRFIAHPNNS